MAGPSREIATRFMRFVNRAGLWSAVKKLGLGVGLIAALSAILLLSDLAHRKTDGTASAGGATSVELSKQKFKAVIVSLAPGVGTDLCTQGLLDGLQASGVSVGKNLELLKADAQGDMINVPAILQNYDNSDVDVILTVSTPCLTGACNKVKQKHVVFTCVSDPIAAGAGKDRQQHLGFLTGVGSFPPVAHHLEMMQKFVPGLRAVGVMYNPAEANSLKEITIAQEVYRSHGVRLQVVAIAGSNEVLQATQILAGKDIQAVWAPADNTVSEGYEGAVKGAQDANLPLFADLCSVIHRGGLACLGVTPHEAGMAAGKLAAKVLQGANPKDLAIEEVAVEQISVRKSNAEKLQIAIPDEYAKYVRP